MTGTLSAGHRSWRTRNQRKGIDQATVDRMLDEAFQQGIKEGQLRSEADFGSAAAALLELFQQLDRIRETLLKNSFGEMQDLALAVAEKIIRSFRSGTGHHPARDR